jgi:hypothetical protein
MNKKELGLVGAAPLSTSSGTLRIQSGDMLRETATHKVLKVVAVYRKYDGGDYYVECEDMDPGAHGSTKIVPLGALSFLMG